MKVLIISDAWHPQINGVVRTYEYLSQELKNLDVDVQVFGPAHFPATLPMPFYQEIRLALLPYKRLKRLIEEFAPDKIHIATEGPLGWAGRRYCLRHDFPFTTSYHTQFPDYIARRFAWLIPPLYRAAHQRAIAFIRKFHNASSTMMVSTASLEEQLRSWDITAPMKRLSRGVDTNLFKPGPKTLFANLKRPVALYVGRLAIEKNLEDFLNMPWGGSKVVVGDGPLRSRLTRDYPETLFTGSKQGRDLADHFRSADVFVFPSKTDTFGIVLIEAMACGLPVSAYNVMGPKDIVIRPELGALDDFSLEKAACLALERGDPQECIKYIKSNYVWKNAALQFLEAL
ncbi:MAG: glycosyltransferase family 1 protein [Alphaproteobacteria bacterium]|nr:glycosyltransferase family 1 protein [Alphaproteobacteria bacterium]MCB9975669.1 glycosyltransferase family 1 protein [Rhodospirillales bacterium]